MDPTRISIARVLALDVPLSWQDAVAVTHEAAVLSEVNAAMNARPSLVTAESCFITKDGAVELPDTTDYESPEDVARLLRDLLAGRDAPDEVEALAYGVAVHELSSDLAALPVGNRHALIAKLATRAIAAEHAPPTRAVDATPSPETPTSAATSARETVPAPPAPLRPVLVPPRTLRPPFVATPSITPGLRPPFVATGDSAAATARVLDDPAPVPEPASAAELERLRQRTVERARPGGLGGALRRALPWLTWRHDSADPRVLGGAAVVMAALVAAVWRGQGVPPATTPGRATTPPGLAASANAAAGASTSGAPTTPTTTGTTGGSSTVGPAASTAVAANTAPATGAMAAPTRARRQPAPAEASTDAPIVITPAESSAASAPPAVAPPPTTVAPSASATSPATVADSPRRAAPSGTPAAPPRAAARVPLYTAADAGVTPPVMLRQQLPSPLEPSVDAPDDWPFLELVIDERGAVEAVRLRAKSLAPGQTLYRHRMLLAAAKAWQFEPATRDGQPVRFLLRVPLEP